MKTKDFTLRLDPDLYEWVKATAAAECRSLSDQVRWFLANQRNRETRALEQYRDLAGDRQPDPYAGTR